MGRGAHGSGGSLRSSVPEAAVNMFKSACGPGCLSLSFACSRAGLGMAPLVLLVLQSCCVYNMHLLVTLKQRAPHKGARSYGDLGNFVFGPRGRVLVNTFVSIQQLGICCVYFQFVSSNLAAVLVNLGIDSVVTRLRRTQLMLAFFFIFAPLSLIRSWKTLAPLSLVANVCIFSGIGIALTYILPAFALVVEWLLGGESARLVPLEESLVPSGAVQHGLPLLFGAVIYSFELVCAVLPIENTMRRPEKVRAVINSSMACYCGLMYVVALLPVVAFGRIREGSLTAELGWRFTEQSDRVMIVGMNLAVTLAVILTFPVQFYPVIEVIEKALHLAGGDLDDAGLRRDGAYAALQDGEQEEGEEEAGEGEGRPGRHSGGGVSPRAGGGADGGVDGDGDGSGGSTYAYEDDDDDETASVLPPASGGRGAGEWTVLEAGPVADGGGGGGARSVGCRRCAVRCLCVLGTLLVPPPWQYSRYRDSATS